ELAFTTQVPAVRVLAGSWVTAPGMLTVPPANVSVPAMFKPPTVVKVRPLAMVRPLVLPMVARLASAGKLEPAPLRVTLAPPNAVILEPAGKFRFELALTIQVPPVSVLAGSCATGKGRFSVP